MANLNDVMAELRIGELRREAEAERIARRMVAKGGGRRRGAHRSLVPRAARSLRAAAAGLAYPGLEPNLSGPREGGPAVSGHSWPARYEIRVDGALDDRWAEWFGLGLRNEGDETVMLGTLADQAALHGVLDRVRDMGLSVIEMRRISPGDEQGRPA